MDHLCVSAGFYVAVFVTIINLCFKRVPLPIKILSGGEGEGVSVSPWSQQHVSFFVFSVQQ